MTVKQILDQKGRNVVTVNPSMGTEEAVRFLSDNKIGAVVVTSGGLSHFPGTSRYAHPDLEFDQKLMAELETANLRWLLSLFPRRLLESSLNGSALIGLLSADQRKGINGNE